jgi:hypothetical protein
MIILMLRRSTRCLSPRIVGSGGAEYLKRERQAAEDNRAHLQEHGIVGINIMFLPVRGRRRC